MKINKKETILIIVLVISILLNIVLLIYVGINTIPKKSNKNIDASTMTDSELLVMFKNEGYDI